MIYDSAIMKRTLLALLLATCAAALAGCLPERDSTKEETTPAKIVQNVGPEFTRDDKSILFSSDRAGNGNIYRVTFDPLDTRVVQLVSYTTDEWTTRGGATPGGTAFLIETNSGGRFTVAAFNPTNASVQAVLSETGANLRNASYSPDGTKIVYSRAALGGYYKVGVANADGSNKRLLTSGSGHDLKPSMSPEGRIVFHRILTTGRADLFVIDDPNAATPVARNLSNTADVDETDPVFSRLEERIYFVQGTSEGDGRIASVLQDGTGGQVVIAATGHYSDLALSYNGQRLAYVHRPNAESPRDIYLATLAGVVTKRLTRGELGPEE